MSILLVAVTYAAAQVGRKITDEVAAALWSKVKGAWSKAFAAEPQPADVTRASLGALETRIPGLEDTLQELMSQSPALRRLRRVQDAVAGARLLWVDDHPDWNTWEIACLEAAGVRIRTVETTRAALALARDDYDLIISDINRGTNATEGLTALPLLREAAPKTPIILYVGRLEPRGVPAGVFGITDRPDELLHFVMDVFERIRL
jgi:CheY-like chemotaxis protein